MEAKLVYFAEFEEAWADLVDQLNVTFVATIKKPADLIGIKLWVWCSGFQLPSEGSDSGSRKKMLKAAASRD